jgi:hypothetical protein
MPRKPTKPPVQKPVVDERQRDELGRGVLRGSVGRLVVDPTLGPRIIAHLAAGWSLATSAQAEGVSERRMMDWLARGRAANEEAGEVDPSNPFAVFADAADRAIARFLGGVEQAIAEAAPVSTDGGGDGRIDPALAASRRWILEKRLSTLYGKRVEHVVRISAMEWVIEALEQSANEGRLSREALHEVLRCLVDVGQETAPAVH